MAGLLYKELILNKKNLLLISGGILFLSIFLFMPASSDFIDGGEAVYTLLMASLCVIFFALAGTLQQGIFAYDERKKWTDFISSTPLSVKGQVLSKYYFSLLISIATFVYCNLAYGINAVIQGKDSGVMNIAIMIFTLQIFIRSIEFPFLIRFGSKYGHNYRMIIGGIIILIVFVYCLFGDMSVFGTFEEFMDWFTKLFKRDLLSDTFLFTIALVPFIVGVMYYLSYKISCRLYLKGAESYDK